MRKLIFTLAMTFCFLGVLAQESGSSITRDLGGDTLARYRVNNLNMDGQAGFKATLGMNDSVAIVLGSDTFYINSTKPIHLWHGGQKVVVGATEFFGEGADYSGILVPSETDGMWLFIVGQTDALADFFPDQAAVFGNPAYGVVGIDDEKTVIARADEGNILLSAEEGDVAVNANEFLVNAGERIFLGVDEGDVVVSAEEGDVAVTAEDFIVNSSNQNSIRADRASYFATNREDTDYEYGFTAFDNADIGSLMTAYVLYEPRMLDISTFFADTTLTAMWLMRNYRQDDSTYGIARISISPENIEIGAGDSTDASGYNSSISLAWDTAHVQIKGNLEVDGGGSFNSTTQFFYPPRMTTAQRDAASPETGAFFFNLDSLKPQYYNGTGWINVE
jgi:hypothetical protein